MSYKKYHFNSIVFKLIFSILLICIPFSYISISSIYHSRNVMVDSIKSAHQDLLKTYTDQLDAEMNNARNFSNSLTLNDPNILPLTINPESSDFYYAGNKLKNTLSSTLTHYQHVNSFFIYIPKTDFYFALINDATSIDEKTIIKDFLFSEVMTTDAYNSLWRNYTIGSTRYLITVTKRNGIYSGSYINLDLLATKLTAENSISFASTDSVIEILKTLDRNTLLMYQPTGSDQLTLYETIDLDSLFSELPFIQKYVLYISIFILLLIPVFFILLNLIIIRPLQKLTKAMNEIQKGNLDYRIESFHHSDEFNKVNNTFNDMIHQVQELKIAVYEEKLSHQKSRLNNLQIQLRPHFMVNSLNMTYNLIFNKEYTIALDLLQFSTNYLRYMFKIQKDYVPLNEEIQHIQNYLNIQLLRYPDTLSYTLDIDPFIDTVPIPPLFLQNFVENSIKYAVYENHKTEISLSISYTEKDQMPYIHIRLKDNGHGYPKELLAPLNKQDSSLLVDSVGLNNSIERAKILYQGQAILNFFNDNGAVNDFFLPII